MASSSTRVIFIGSSTPEQMIEFLGRGQTQSFCGDLFTDPSLALYRYFGLKRGVFRSLVRPVFSSLKDYGLRGIVEGIRLAKETSHLAGDSWQQGGSVLLDREGSILYQHVEEHPTDWPDMKEVLQLVGISEMKVDYKKALSDWLKIRQENRNQKKL